MAKQRSAEREQFLGDVLTTALEGGIGYWSLAADIVRDEDLTVRSVKLFVSEGCHLCKEDDRPATEQEIVDAYTDDGKNRDPQFHDYGYFGAVILGCKGHEVTRDTIAHGFTVVSDREKYADIHLHSDYRTTYVQASRDPEESDLDAGDADNILQAGLFEDVVFG